MNTNENGPVASLAASTGSAPVYFFLPNHPKDILYGYADKPDKAELAAFVNQRHAHISQSCDAEIFCHALNGAPHFDRQTLELVTLRAENKRLRADLKEAQRALEDDGEFTDEHDL